MLGALLRIAVTAGIGAGLVLDLLQQLSVFPLLRIAQQRDVTALIEHAGAPGPGLAVALLATDVLAGIGLALLLEAAILLDGRNIDGRRGLLWGLAGYVALFALPALGLPPRLPGTALPLLVLRQGWWLLAAGCSVAGLALLLLGRRWWWRALGLVLLVLPHLVGAPQPALQVAAVPAALNQRFVLATAWTNAVFWLLLGGACGVLHRRWQQTQS